MDRIKTDYRALIKVEAGPLKKVEAGRKYISICKNPDFFEV
jgi:hypothetical protein